LRGFVSVKNSLLNLLLFLFFFFLLNSKLVISTNLSSTLQDFCRMMFGIVADLATVMVVLSSISYTAGQFLSAEMRARAVIWSQSMLSGAVIGLVLIIIVPYILGVLIGKNWDANSCQFT
jgi:hypothetical protein